MRKQIPVIERARDIINGAHRPNVDELLQHCAELKKHNAYPYARRILEQVTDYNNLQPATVLSIKNELARCTYKDINIPTQERFDKALKILEASEQDFADRIYHQETLGIIGSIYKHKWECDGKRRHLYSALKYYELGLQKGISYDFGYTAANAAFIHDLLAEIERKDGAAIELVEQHTLEAHRIRTEIIDELTVLKSFNSDYSLFVTLAETYLGLGNYAEAKIWLERAINAPKVEDWEKENTMSQLARIASMREVYDSSEGVDVTAWNVLTEVLSAELGTELALKSLIKGKTGLALSGGGFRASFYHIGVLARLAEMDELRHIEVISCVSGGSIIGAYYYLEVRKLLQERHDSEITAKDYVEIVQKISQEFLQGVQNNIRTRIFTNLWSNLKMCVNPDYSRTTRAGELFEEILYSRIADGEGEKDRWLDELLIFPKQQDGSRDENFNPKYHNWRRRNKVPILILNATTLNTGHNWQFTVSWMGESPSAIQEIDSNYLLRRMYYKRDGDERHQRRIRLGQAVAASACVPGLFEPLKLKNLFEGKDIRLVDGGVHDNQGICGLLEQNVQVMFVSDASGQMSSEDKPGVSIANVLPRSNNILQERVRNGQFQDMKNRYNSGVLKGFMFIHLKQGLDVQAIDWVNCEDPQVQKGPSNDQRLTSYSIRKDMQARLAAIRTDLDSFNDTEAFSLMASGYQMTDSEFSKSVKRSPNAITRSKWSFSDLLYELKRPDASPELEKLLAVAKERIFKFFKLQKYYRYVFIALVSAFLLSISYLTFLHHTDYLAKLDFPLSYLIATVSFLLPGLFFNNRILQALRYRETLVLLGLGLVAIIIVWFFANIHLYIFDKLYLKKGIWNRSSAIDNEENTNRELFEQTIQPEMA